jgi:hypothetical protein
LIELEVLSKIERQMYLGQRRRRRVFRMAYLVGEEAGKKMDVVVVVRPIS